ncbi:uncharacterized protein LOC108347849 [Vigna angularis]|nr:uncharacterized protein LOC108347849 [Vigna angularis]
MSSQKTSIQNVLAPTTRPPPNSKPPTTGTKLPTVQQVFARRPKSHCHVLSAFSSVCRIDRHNPHRLELLSHCTMSSQKRIQDVLAHSTRPPSESSKSETSSSGAITIHNVLIHTTRPPPKISTSKSSTTRPK